MTSILSSITRGRTLDAPRIILYGMEGIGKSTFAAKFPSPIFIQTEDVLGMIDCAKFPLAKSFDEVFQELVALVTEPNVFKTIVIDSLDWLERLIWDKVAKDSKVDNIEQIGYGKGYTIALTFWRIVLDHLASLHQQGKIILLLAHAVAED